MSEYSNDIEESIDLLNLLFPNKVIEITDAEEKILGERVFAIEGLAVFLSFIVSGENNIQSHTVKPTVKIKLWKTEFVDDCESKMTQLIDLEELAIYAGDDFKMLHEALRRQCEKHGK